MAGLLDNYTTSFIHWLSSTPRSQFYFFLANRWYVVNRIHTPASISCCVESKCQQQLSNCCSRIDYLTRKPSIFSYQVFLHSSTWNPTVFTDSLVWKYFWRFRIEFLFSRTRKSSSYRGRFTEQKCWHILEMPCNLAGYYDSFYSSLQTSISGWREAGVGYNHTVQTRNSADGLNELHRRKEAVDSKYQQANVKRLPTEKVNDHLYRGRNRMNACI